MDKSSQITGLVISIIICLGVGFIAGRFQPGEWYQSLVKPTWTPPGWVFPVVWTLLYIMMGVAAWLVWKQKGFIAASLPLSFFILQLVLNGLWTVFFFGLKSPGLALVDIAFLWAAILATVIMFWIRQPLAGILLLPYLLWVSFASALNYSIWRLN